MPAANSSAVISHLVFRARHFRHAGKTIQQASVVNYELPSITSCQILLKGRGSSLDLLTFVRSVEPLMVCSCTLRADAALSGRALLGLHRLDPSWN